MTITIIEYGGKEKQVECDSFEFRSNHVNNWIKIKKGDFSYIIHDICVITTEGKDV
jgi:hypothetical protein